MVKPWHKQHPARSALKILIIVFVICLVAFCGYVALRDDNHRARLEADIEALQTDLHTQGMSDTQKSQKCSNTDQVWGLGQETCATVLTTKIYTDTTDQANLNVEEYSDVINKDSDFRVLEPLSGIQSSAQDEQYTGSAQYLHTKTHTLCDAGYVYNTQERLLQLELSCSE